MKNFALIGCGAIAGMHATAIEGLHNGKLYGVFDTRAECAEAFAREHGCKAFSTVEEMLACKDVDIVSICTPSGLHAKLAVQAAERFPLARILGSAGEAKRDIVIGVVKINSVILMAVVVRIDMSRAVTVIPAVHIIPVYSLERGGAL